MGFQTTGLNSAPAESLLFTSKEVFTLTIMNLKYVKINDFEVKSPFSKTIKHYHEFLNLKGFKCDQSDKNFKNIR